MDEPYLFWYKSVICYAWINGDFQRYECFKCKPVVKISFMKTHLVIFNSHDNMFYVIGKISGPLASYEDENTKSDVFCFPVRMLSANVK